MKMAFFVFFVENTLKSKTKILFHIINIDDPEQDNHVGYSIQFQ